MTRPQKPNRAQRRKSGQAPASQRAAARAVKGWVELGVPREVLGGRAGLPSDGKMSFSQSFGRVVLDRIANAPLRGHDMMIESFDAGLKRYLGYDR